MKTSTLMKTVITALIMATASASWAEIMPSDRRTLWQPGVTYNGGIPTNRTQYGPTLMPSGGDDTAAIQEALNRCPANQFVLLGAGTFRISGGGLTIEKSHITLRGSGPDLTRLVKPQGTSAAVISM